MDFRIRGAALTITAADIRRATCDVSPTAVDGRYKYFVELHGQRFPITQVLRLATGLPSAGFTTQDALRVLSRLRFGIFVDRGPTPAHRETPPRTSEEAALIIDGSSNQDDVEVMRALVVFQSDEDGWEVASCPSLPGCHSQGRTREEALHSIREAISGYLASLREHDDALPRSSEFQIITASNRTSLLMRQRTD